MFCNNNNKVDIVFSDTDKIKNDPQRMKDLADVMGTLTVYAGDTVQLPGAVELLEMFGKVSLVTIDILMYNVSLYPVNES